VHKDGKRKNSFLHSIIPKLAAVFFDYSPAKFEHKHLSPPSVRRVKQEPRIFSIQLNHGGKSRRRWYHKKASDPGNPHEIGIFSVLSCYTTMILDTILKEFRKSFNFDYIKMCRRT
jgi:hypothetical protein